MFRFRPFSLLFLIVGLALQGCAVGIHEPHGDSTAMIYGYLNTPWGVPDEIKFIKLGDPFSMRDAFIDRSGIFFVDSLSPGKYVMLSFRRGDKNYDMFKSDAYFDLHPGELHDYGAFEILGQKDVAWKTSRFSFDSVERPNGIEILTKIKGLKEMAASAWLPLIDNEIETLKKH